MEQMTEVSVKKLQEWTIWLVWIA